MSRIGVQPLEIPSGVEIKIEENDGQMGGQRIGVKGPLGELELDTRSGIICKMIDNKLTVERTDDSKQKRSLHGLYRTLLSNMIEGVTKGYEKELEMVGIGYRAETSGREIKLTAGATHPYIIEAPEGILFEVNDKVNIKVKGIDKQLVGQLAAKIREMSKPEPYRGKGIRYKDEYVRRKAGKAAKASEGGGEE
ncbi:MAG: 50S ribosomal protein L6 [Candidatus Dojkabacteria bacterium]|nr:50S ribosomal protein L6 [Candidatus Dojkabacteria bacterium]